MEYIKQLANQFRDAIDKAKNTGEFVEDFSFCRFPLGCCGDASVLLAQFLLESNIKTYYVCGRRYGVNLQSHAWLLTEDKIIIDITGDQFKDNPVFLNYDKSVYVGIEDAFHKLFEINDREVHENLGLNSLDCIRPFRLSGLYQNIIKYIISS